MEVDMAEKKGPKITVTSKKKSAGGGASKAKMDSTSRLIDLPDDLADWAREIWLAGLGALATVEQEGVKVFNNLVRKGETWERESRQQLGTTQEAAREAAKDRMEEAKGRLDAARERVEAVVGEATSKQAEMTRSLEEKISTAVEESLEVVLKSVGMLTRSEVRELSARVEQLAKQVATLTAAVSQEKATRSRPPRPAGAPAADGRAVYHVVPHEGGWAVKREGDAQAMSVHDTKAPALERARELARASEPSQLVIHRKDGTIQDSATYGD
jgi:poly(hydroxyalkanoate) granule-associated protein